MPGFEERFSNLFQRGSARAQQAVAAAKGQGMPPIGGNRVANFTPFPPGTDPSVNFEATGIIRRGVYRVPILNSIVNRNSGLPTVSATPDKSAGVRLTATPDPTRAVARGSVTQSAGGGRRTIRPDEGYSSSTSWDRARSRLVAARVRARKLLRGG